jgi:Ran GTPase-activating protein (RanGAP) involved in mRNA processing and transport
MNLNSTLETIYLRQNNIGDTGAAAVGSSLANNSSLMEINLSANHIGDIGASAIAKGLESNTTIQRVYMFHNPIGETGKSSFIRAFRKGLHIDVIQLEYGFFARSAESILQKRVVQKMTHHELPDGLFPHVVAFLSKKDQHVNKLFCILSERPELVKDAF